MTENFPKETSITDLKDQTRIKKQKKTKMNEGCKAIRNTMTKPKLEK